MKDYKDYKEKGKKSFYMAKDSDSSDDDEMVYIAIKDDEDNEDDKMTLISHVIKNNIWIIDSGYSHHMISDKIEFKHLEHYDGGSIRFGNNEPYHIKRKGFLLSVA